VPGSAHTIPTTHTGSLPRPDALIASMWAQGDGVPVDSDALARQIDEAVADAVRRQVRAGVTVVNDGEMSKPSYATYVQHRLTGFAGESVQSYHFQDLVEFPKSVELVQANPGRRKRSAPACTGPIQVKDLAPATEDAKRLAREATAAEAIDTFSSAASPGVVSLFFANQRYPSHEAYVFAIAEAMRAEYEAVVDGGATLQLDCPDLAMGRHTAYADQDDTTFRKTVGLHIEALNHAVRSIPADRLRMHLCWGCGASTRTSPGRSSNP